MHATATPDDGPLVRFEVTATKPERVCVGTDTTIVVNVVRYVSPPNSPELAMAGLPGRMPNVVVDATIQDGAVLSTENSTQITGLDGSEPPEAVFTFRALKAGVTDIGFTAKLAAMPETDPDLFKGPLTDQSISRTVTVVNCKFELSVLSTGTNLTGLIFKAQVEFGDDGHFENSLFVSWISHITVPTGCGVATLTAQDGTADLVATMDQQGAVTFAITYATIPTTVAVCGGSAPISMTPGTLNFTVGTHGGTDQLPQAMVGYQVGVFKARYHVVPIDVGS